MEFEIGVKNELEGKVLITDYSKDYD